MAAITQLDPLQAPPRIRGSLDQPAFQVGDEPTGPLLIGERGDGSGKGRIADSAIRQAGVGNEWFWRQTSGMTDFSAQLQKGQRPGGIDHQGFEGVAAGSRRQKRLPPGCCGCGQTG